MKRFGEAYYDSKGRLVQFVGFWPDGEEKEIVLREADIEDILATVPVIVFVRIDDDVGVVVFPSSPLPV